MKILHILQFLGIGGLERIVLSLCQKQQEMGFIVSVYVYDYEQSWVEFFREQGINVIVPNELKKPGIDFSLFRKIYSLSKKYDIIHTHDLNPLIYSSLVGFSKSLRLSHPAHIHTTHGLDHLENDKNSSFFERHCAPKANRLICVSKNVASYYRDTLGIKASKVIQIDNGVKTFKAEITTDMRSSARDWLCKRHQLDSSKPILICIARVVELKDQAFLMKAIAKRPELQLLVVGPVEENYKKILTPLSSSKIILTGPQSEVERYNMGSDLYLSASTHEGIPVAVLEAMSVETPCLVSNIPGHLVLNQHGSMASIYEIGNEESFLNELDKVLETNLKESGRIARKLTEKHYSLEAMAQKVQAVYEEALC